MLFPRLVLSIYLLSELSAPCQLLYISTICSWLPVIYFWAKFALNFIYMTDFFYIEWSLKLIKNDINGSHHSNIFLTQLNLFHINKWYHHQTRCSSQNVVVSPLSVSHTSKLFTYLFYSYHLHLHCLSIVKTTLISHLVTFNKVSQTGLSILPSYNLFYFK